VRPLKWILIALAGIVALLLAGVLIVTQWVDPDVFKPRIVAALAKATGRPVALPGDLELSWYPWLALRTGEGSLGNPSGVTGPPLLAWREARLGARLLPLLRGELVLDRVRFDGLDLQLRRDAAGRGNWEGLATGSGGSPAVAPLSLAGLELRGARVGFVDEAAGTRLLVEGLDLTTGAWTAGQASPLALQAAFALSSGGRRVLEQATLQTAVALPGGGSLAFALGATTFAARVFVPGLAPAGLPLRVELPSASLDLGRAAYRAPSLQVALGAARLVLEGLAYDQPGESPARATVGFSLAPTSLRALLAALGIEAPLTADPRALESFGADGRVALADGSLTIEPLSILLDDTRLVGRVRRGGDPALAEFTLAGNTMNVDRYLEPEGIESEPFRFPGEALGALRARGTLTLEDATFDDLRFEGLTVRLLLDEGGLRGDPAAPAPSRTAPRAAR
jgi:AsmA protein